MHIHTYFGFIMHNFWNLDHNKKLNRLQQALIDAYFRLSSVSEYASNSVPLWIPVCLNRKLRVIY